MRPNFCGIKILSFCVLFILVACDSETASDKNVQDIARPAKLMTIGQVGTQNLLSFPAVIQSQKLSELTFEVGGVLEELLVVEAQKVKEGDVLATLDQRDLNEKLNSARAQYDNAEAEYQRALRLIKEDAISRSKLDERKSKRDVNKATFKTAKKALDRTVLRAPYSGAIAKISIEKLQVVQAGQPAISILGRGGYEATINLPASIIAQSKGEGKSDDSTYLVLDAAPAHKIPAVFKGASLEADPTSQTYEITFSFASPEGVTILPGMNAIIWVKDPRIDADRIRNISVPLTAIAIDGEQKYVWLVNQDTMIVSRRDIVVKDGVGKTLDIIDGLTFGDMIVSAGVSSISEGIKVRLWSK